MQKSINERFIGSIQAAKDYVESNLPKAEKDEKINRFFDCIEEFSQTYGEERLQKSLMELGFNSYETGKIIDLKNQSQITDAALVFFKEIDIDLSVNDYSSPLSKNKNWLSASVIEADKLSEQYGKLVEYISTFEKNQKAEFLAILDKYVSVSSQNPGKHDLLRLFQNFNPQNKYIMELLTIELNSFCSRYSIDDTGRASPIYEKIFKLNNKGHLSFTRGQARATDCVFTDIDGSKGLICSTSETNTENQQQIFKFRKALMEHFGSNVNCYIYCDSLVRYNENKSMGPGRPSKSTNVNIQSIDRNYIVAMNLIGALQVFTITDLGDGDFFKETIEKTQIQLFNNDGGTKVANMTARSKIALIEESAVMAFELIAANKEFWLTNTIAKDLQKKFLLDLCNTYVWLHNNDLIENPALTAYAKSALTDYTLDTHVNINSKDRQLLISAKTILGLNINKITFS